MQSLARAQEREGEEEYRAEEHAVRGIKFNAF